MFGAGVCPVSGQLDPADPWPKFGRDERNTFFAPWPGPHVQPTVLWWGSLGERQSPEPFLHYGGAAAAYFLSSGTIIPYILVPKPYAPGLPPEPEDVYVYKARYAPEELGLDGRAGPISTFRQHAPLLGGIASTPLVLADDRVVIHTSALEVWNLSDPYHPYREWAWPLGGTISNSPATGYIDQAGTAARVYVISNGGELFCFALGIPNPLDWSCVLDPTRRDQGYSTPAIGPISGDPRNFVYATIFGPSQGYDHLFALYADGNPGGNAVAWAHTIDLQQWPKYGTYASPNVHHAAESTVPNKPLVTSDDWGVYAFDNVIQVAAPLRWVRECGQSISCTPAVGPDGYFVFWNEGKALVGAYDTLSGPDFERATQMWVSGDMIFGAPVLDSYGRVFVATTGEDSDRDGRSVLAYQTPLQGDDLWIWRWSQRDYFPSTHKTWAPLSMDDAGTLYCVTQNRVIALGVPRGDLNGDGQVNTMDIDALVLVFEDRAAWYKQYGKPLGVNLLGVGDGNQDHRLDGKDLLPLTERMARSRVGGDDGWNYFCAGRDYLLATYGK